MPLRKAENGTLVIIHEPAKAFQLLHAGVPDAHFFHSKVASGKSLAVSNN